MLALRRVDIYHHPIRLKATSQARHLPHECVVTGTPAHSHQEPLSRGPDIADGTLAAVVAHVLIHTIRSAPQRQLSQREQVAAPKEMPRCALGLLQVIDLAILEPPQQLVGRDVDHHHFIGIVKNLVGHGLAHLDADDATHHIVQALQVLHIDRGPHIDARIQQLLHILPTLGVARSRRVAVRKFIEQQHLRMPRQRRIEIELAQLLALITHRQQRQLLQIAQALRSFCAAMRFHQTHKHLTPRLPLALRGRQHGVGFPHARVRAKVDPQLAAMGGGLLGLQARHQRIGIGAQIVGIGWGVRHISQRLPSDQTSPNAEMITSINLMPMNGTIKPPRP